MVLKRSKAHKKLAKKAAQALAPVAEKPYLPPSRDSLDPVEWVELFDGTIISRRSVE
ncbi:MAG: hypothetical protein MSC45_03205 [Mobiluncus sp.]|uniref:hypothetical protein n=1 Tax=Mobiluncus sp. TaxID=47293 RepID=UPI00258272DD|nr:hypothetical protein [Mobiluncus sp.]MCI6584065.1 hypothetical protein [Mobiluncus sp.]